MSIITQEEIVETLEAPDKLGICAKHEHLVHIKNINGRDVIVISQVNQPIADLKAEVLCAMEVHPPEFYDSTIRHAD